MRFLALVALALGSCSTLMTAGAAGAGAAIGSLGGPGLAAVGAAGGVVTAELLEKEVPPEALEVVGTGPAATIHETTSLVETIGLGYLLIFVLLPFLSKRGRGWIKNFTTLHNAVSQKEIKERDEEHQITKKEVALQQQRLDNLESILKTTPSGASLLVEEKK